MVHPMGIRAQPRAGIITAKASMLEHDGYYILYAAPSWAFFPSSMHSLSGHSSLTCQPTPLRDIFHSYTHTFASTSAYLYLI